jgi:four helix bundle protein
MRRAAVSIEANIAEGCGRWGDGEFGRFLQIAAGSASELECHLLIAKDLEFLTAAEHRRLKAALDEVCRMLTSLRQRVGSAAAGS